MVRGGRLITPKLTDSVLESITRDTIIAIAGDLNIDTEERSIDRTELYTCDEAFLCGSAMEITPVFSVDQYEISKEMGEVTDRLYRTYCNAVRGNIKEYEHWLTPVYEKSCQEISLFDGEVIWRGIT